MSTYFIMYSERVNYEIKIIFSKISSSFMAHWKKLAQHGKDVQSNYSGAKSRKYTPKKSFREQNSPMRFHNQTLDKINNSALSQQKQKSLGKSFIAKSIDQEQSKGLKSSSSQIKLNNQYLGGNLKKNNSIQVQQTDPVIENRRISQKNSQDPINMKRERSLLFQQIQKLKKQFITFQSTILRQLNRQQKLINTMVTQILQKIKEGSIKETKQKQESIYSYENHSPLTPQAKNNPTTKIFQKKNSLNLLKQDVNSEKSKQSGGIKFSFQNENICFDFDRKKNSLGFSFQKFFKAVNTLKSQLKEMNDITQIPPSLGTPTINRMNFDWQQFKVA